MGFVRCHHVTRHKLLHRALGAGPIIFRLTLRGPKSRAKTGESCLHDMSVFQDPGIIMLVVKRVFMLSMRRYGPISLGIVSSMGSQYRGKRDGPPPDSSSKLLSYDVYDRFAAGLKHSSGRPETAWSYCASQSVSCMLAVPRVSGHGSTRHGPLRPLIV